MNLVDLKAMVRDLGAKIEAAFKGDETAAAAELHSLAAALHDEFASALTVLEARVTKLESAAGAGTPPPSVPSAPPPAP